MNKDSRSKLNLREKAIVEKISQGRQHVFSKFPLVFTLMATIGVVATYYGFERLLDKVTFFSDNPWLLLGFGIGTLIFTGTLYKKLQ